MRIYGPNGTVPGAATPAVRRGPVGTFRLPEMPAARDARPAVAPMAATSIDALIALQGIEDATERKRRFVSRGRNALDVLDELKIGLLSGRMTPATLSRLRDAASDLKGSSGDPGLDAILAEIELRVEVELAKASHR